MITTKIRYLFFVLSVICIPITLNTHTPAHDGSLVTERISISPLQEPALRLFASIVASLPNKTPHSAQAKAKSIRLFSKLYQIDSPYLHEVLSVFVRQLNNLSKSFLVRASVRDKHLVLLLEESKHVIKSIVVKESISLNGDDVDHLMESLYAAISPTLNSFWWRVLKWTGGTAAVTAALYSALLIYRKFDDTALTATKVLGGPYELAVALNDSPFSREMGRSHHRYDVLLREHGYKEGAFDVDVGDTVEELNDAGIPTRYALSRLFDKAGKPLKEGHKKEDRKVLRIPLNLGDALIQFFANPNSHGAQLALQIAKEFKRVNEADDINLKRFGVNLKTAKRVIVRGPAAHDFQHEPVGHMPEELRRSSLDKLPEESLDRIRNENERQLVIDFQIERGLIKSADEFDEDHVIPPHGYGLGYGLAHGFANSHGHIAKLVNNIDLLHKRIAEVAEKHGPDKNVLVAILEDAQVIAAVKNLFDQTITTEQTKAFIKSLLNSPEMQTAFGVIGTNVARGFTFRNPLRH